MAVFDQKAALRLILAAQSQGLPIKNCAVR
jgi:hypothetical protein